MDASCPCAAVLVPTRRYDRRLVLLVHVVQRIWQRSQIRTMGRKISFKLTETSNATGKWRKECDLHSCVKTRAFNYSEYHYNAKICPRVRATSAARKRIFHHSSVRPVRTRPSLAQSPPEQHTLHGSHPYQIHRLPLGKLLCWRQRSVAVGHRDPTPNGATSLTPSRLAFSQTVRPATCRWATDSREHGGDAFYVWAGGGWGHDCYVLLAWLSNSTARWLDERVMELFIVDINLTTKLIVKAKLDQHYLTPSETIVLIYFHTIFCWSCEDARLFQLGRQW